MRLYWTALVLLLVGCFNAYFWQLFPGDGDSEGQVWNITGSSYRILLLALVAIWARAEAMTWVCAVLIGLDAMVTGCSAAFLVAPWPLHTGEPLCSTKFHAPLGVIGAVIALALVLKIVRGKR